MSKPKISVLLYAGEYLPYSEIEFHRTIRSLQDQYVKNFQVILFGEGKNGYAQKLASENQYVFVDTTGKSKSETLNSAFAATTGDCVLVCNNEKNVIEFKRSAMAFYSMVMDRHPDCSLLYSDYDLLDNGTHKPRKLLEFHPGRVCDSWDMGYCLLFRRSFLEKAAFADERYKFNPLYDLRLKAFESGEIVHVSNRFNGVPYIFHAAAKGLDVFAYLKAGKKIALELEEIFTDHLKRIGAYLAPSQNYRSVKYSPQEEEAFKRCIASVVIPVFGRPEFIGPAIESVQAQTIRNIEAVVVCNGGEDDATVPEVKRYMPDGDRYDPTKPGVRLIVHDINNLGLCFNDALQSCKSKYYVQLDSDDLLFPEAVEKILQVYKQDDRIGMVIGSYQVFEKKPSGDVVPVLVNDTLFIVTHDEWTEDNGRNNLLRIGGAGAPRSIQIKVLKEMGWFGMNDSPYTRNYGEDYELVNKVAEKYCIGRVWEPIYKVVRHAGGTDHNIDQMTIDVNENAKDHMRLEAIRRRQTMNGVERTV